MGRAAAKRAAILALLRSEERPMRHKEIQAALGYSSGYVSDLLAQLTWQGRVLPTREGYRLTSRGEASHD